MPGYTRRQLKEDKFAETAQGAAQWASGHRQTVLWIVGLALTAILLTAGVIAWRSRESEQANMQLSAAMRTMDAQIVPAGTPSHAGFRPNVPQHRRSGQSGPEAVQSHCGQILHGFSGKDCPLHERSCVAAGRGQGRRRAGIERSRKFRRQGCCRTGKNGAGIHLSWIQPRGDAIAIYKDLSEHPTATVSKPQAQLELAEMYETTDPQQATLIYQQLQKDDPRSPAAQVAGQKLTKAK